MKRWSEALGGLTTFTATASPPPSILQPYAGLSLYERWSRGRKGARTQCNLPCLHQSGERGKKKGEGEGKFQGKETGSSDQEAPNGMNRSLCKTQQALSGLFRTGFSQSKLGFHSSFWPRQGLSGIGLVVSQTSWSLVITRPGILFFLIIYASPDWALQEQEAVWLYPSSQHPPHFESQVPSTELSYKEDRECKMEAAMLSLIGVCAPALKVLLAWPCQPDWVGHNRKVPSIWFSLYLLYILFILVSVSGKLQCYKYFCRLRYDLLCIDKLHPHFLAASLQRTLHRVSFRSTWA